MSCNVPLVKIEIPSFSPSEAVLGLTGSSPSSHTPRQAWSSSALAAAASLQPLPSSCSRSLLVGECWEPLLDILWVRASLCAGTAAHTGTLSTTHYGTLWALPLLRVSSWMLSLSMAMGLKEECSCLQAPYLLFHLCQHSLFFSLIICLAQTWVL